MINKCYNALGKELVEVKFVVSQKLYATRLGYFIC